MSWPSYHYPKNVKAIYQVIQLIKLIIRSKKDNMIILVEAKKDFIKSQSCFVLKTLKTRNKKGISLTTSKEQLSQINNQHQINGETL